MSLVQKLSLNFKFKQKIAEKYKNYTEHKTQITRTADGLVTKIVISSKQQNSCNLFLYI